MFGSIIKGPRQPWKARSFSCPLLLYRRWYTKLQVKWVRMTNTQFRFRFQLIFFSVVPYLTCHVCGNGFPYSCDDFDPIGEEFKTTCSSHTKSCVKSYGVFQNVTGKLIFKMRGCCSLASPWKHLHLPVSNKSCGDGESMNGCSTMTLGGAKATVCSCDQDLCNGMVDQRHFMSSSLLTGVSLSVLMLSDAYL